MPRVGFGSGSPAVVRVVLGHTLLLWINLTGQVADILLYGKK